MTPWPFLATLALLLGPALAACAEAPTRTSREEAPLLRRVATFAADRPAARFGRFVASGDWNGDGVDDVAVGAPYWSDAGPFPIDPSSFQASKDGRVAVYLGSHEGFAAPAWLAAPSAAGQWGHATATAGDADGDGADDLIACSIHGPGPAGELRAGSCALLRGGPDGVEGVPVATVDGTGAAEELGWGAAAVGDLDCDGFEDAGVASQVGLGRVVVLSGGPEPWATRQELVGPDDGSGFGAAMAGAGDLDGDGCDDLLVGAPESAGRGRVFVFRGGSGGPLPAPDLVGVGEPGEQFGASLAGVGDLDGDGYDDAVVGAPGTEEDAGSVSVFLGGPGGLRPGPRVERARSTLGLRVAAAGDVDGDGLPDFAASTAAMVWTSELDAAVEVFALRGDALVPLIRIVEEGTTASFGSWLEPAFPGGRGAKGLLVGEKEADAGDLERAGVVHLYR